MRLAVHRASSKTAAHAYETSIIKSLFPELVSSPVTRRQLVEFLLSLAVSLNFRVFEIIHNAACSAATKLLSRVDSEPSAFLKESERVVSVVLSLMHAAECLLPCVRRL